MNFLRCAGSVLLAVGLLACGGGGGPDTSVKVSTLSPTIDMSLVDASGVTINSKALSQTAARYLKVVLKTKVGAAAPYTRITVALDAPDAVLVPTSGIGFTDDMGVMLMGVSPASVSAAGGVVATASASVENVALSKALDLAITSGSVGLSDFQVSPASVQQGQSLTVSVAVQVNGVKAS